MLFILSWIKLSTAQVSQNELAQVRSIVFGKIGLLSMPPPLMLNIVLPIKLLTAENPIAQSNIFITCRG